MGSILQIKIKKQKLDFDDLIDAFDDIELENQKCNYKNKNMTQKEINKLPAKYFFNVPLWLDVYKALDGNWYERESKALLLRPGLYNCNTIWLKENGRIYKRNSDFTWKEIS